MSQMIPTSEDIADSLPWINGDSLQSWLREYQQCSTLVVTKYQVNPAAAKGENYLSDLYRVTVSVKNSPNEPNTISLILKCKPKGGYREDFVNTGRFFTKELDMFSTVLPEISSLLKGLNCNVKLIPDFLHYVKDAKAFVMGDLSKSGFRLAKRSGLDLEHCKMVMQSLGIFHAVSAVLSEQKPELVNLYRQEVFCEETQSYMGAYLMSTIRSLAEEVENWPGYEKYGDKLRSVAEDSWQMIKIAVTRDESSFNVLNHGDLWVNNIMFRYTEPGQLVDLCFVDFQMGCFTSPAIDLHYFMYSSPQSEVRALHCDILLEDYHNSLCDSLSSLGYTKSMPTLDELKQDLNRRMFYAFFAATSSLPNILADLDERFDLESSLENGENPSSSNRNMYRSKMYTKEIRRLLPIFEKHGIF